MTSHLGALNMFPHRLAAALEVALAQRLVTENFALQDRLKLLHALGRLRWRSKQLLSPILEPLDKEKLSAFSHKESATRGSRLGAARRGSLGGNHL